MFREFDYDNKPVVDIVNEMILDAVKLGGSDIHFDPTEDELIVRIRVDGSLLEYAKVPSTVKKNLITRIKIISGMNITETRLPQDGSIKGLIENLDVDLRVSSLPIVDGEKIVIRVLDYSMSLSGLESIGLTKDNLAKVNELIKKPNGIIMITGATGSGKSTTVYSMLQVLNTTERNIITVEDPVEMKIAGINQVQVMSEIGLTFGNTLRSILRQDPDIIMIGEIRDDETARIAVRASITGHLVLSTIHTNNSLNTIERLLDMDVERYLLGSALSGIISQRLVKKLCPKCRSARQTNSYEKNLFKKVLDMDVAQIYTPIGCNECINGYKGRVAVHEVLEITQDIRDAIVSNVRKEELRKLVYGNDGNTLLKDGLIKVIEGFTSMDEIVRVIDVNDDFGEDDQELKDAIIGKPSKNTNVNQQMTHNPFATQNIETL
ncbi:MAG: type II/IV secretion system protein [Firmicutes bacterium]|nr:type II/IV secretion system protein [Bacillota bacterium]